MRHAALFLLAGSTARRVVAACLAPRSRLIGTTREEMMSRELSELVREGLLRKEGRAWVLPGFGVLRARVDGTRQ
ncbi:hypothetical protein PY257_06285 [Ramlibacter sp. H39-3-26]|uniref:hypothetical protein n=1 Tax=Curvibacter soli TaxID=3031331 RepID=UPI0023DA1FAC|nr:hypothetical protein [Ramlibacter sp. H39-3-26]MDF1484797.1 hypothetical protein [Ramlibacter sp. H39-3-26]